MKTKSNYSVVLEPQKDGGFTALVPALPEIVTEGETEAEALANAKEAIRVVLEYRRNYGLPIPPPDISAERVYYPTDFELRAIQEGMAAIRRGEIATDEEVKAVFVKNRRKDRLK
jgi:antitoxin HicB